MELEKQRLGRMEIEKQDLGVIREEGKELIENLGGLGK